MNSICRHERHKLNNTPKKKKQNLKNQVTKLTLYKRRPSSSEFPTPTCSPRNVNGNKSRKSFVSPFTLCRTNLAQIAILSHVNPLQQVTSRSKNYFQAHSFFLAHPNASFHVLASSSPLVIIG